MNEGCTWHVLSKAVCKVSSCAHAGKQIVMFTDALIINEKTLPTTIFLFFDLLLSRCF